MTIRINTNQLKMFMSSFRAMGSPCEIQLYAASATAAKHSLKSCRTLINHLEQNYSRYIKNNLMARINMAGQTGSRIKVDEETAVLLDYAELCYMNSDGLFDITSGILRRAWDFKSNRLPDKKSVEILLDCVGWGKVCWNKPELVFHNKNMELDFGGIVKEYAADRAATLLRDQGIHHGLVNLGGDIRIVGPIPPARPWEIGIRDPFDKSAKVGQLRVTQGGISSSGDYERCMTIAGRRYAHLLDPKTGWPVSGLSSVTVIADFCLVAGSASTIAMLKGRQGPEWLQDNGFKAIWIFDDGTTGSSF